MYCAFCGTEIQQAQNFCSRCGRPAAANSGMPPAPTTGNATAGFAANQAEFRLARHLRTLGILWIVGSILRLIPGLTMLLAGRMAFMFIPMPARAIVVPIVGSLGALFTIASLIGLLAGWGLLERRPWARTLAIVLGCLVLVDFPFGTALGVFTLWVLLADGAEAEYQRLAGFR